ncbi:MAG: tRNA (adenosine(37)-N6)-dimethylallyltransferase MiaA [Bacteroidota bacterium]
MQKKHLIVIVGPTAVGKTAMSINIAEKLDTVILSADSRQFYREMELGTAKPDDKEQAAVKHYFVNSLSIHSTFNAGQYEREALEVLEQVFHHNNHAVVVGGSGLYVKALCEGIDEMPEIDASIREKLNAEKETYGLESLVKRLHQVDPEYAAMVDLKNPQRVIRALEVIEGTGKTYSAYRKATTVAERSFEIVKVGLEMPRERLYERIELRMDHMISNGLFEEAEALFPFRHLNALQTVGYTEIFGYMEGSYDKQEAIRLLKRNSRRYAKRQLTWFKRDPQVRWFTPDQQGDIISYLSKSLDIEDVY